MKNSILEYLCPKYERNIKLINHTITRLKTRFEPI